MLRHCPPGEACEEDGREPAGASRLPPHLRLPHQWPFQVREAGQRGQPADDARQDSGPGTVVSAMFCGDLCTGQAFTIVAMMSGVVVQMRQNAWVKPTGQVDQTEAGAPLIIRESKE